MDRLRKLRRERDIKQSDLSDYMSVSQGTLSLWENGKKEPDLASLAKLADYFQVSIDFLLGKCDIPQPVQYRNESEEILTMIVTSCLEE